MFDFSVRQTIESGHAELCKTRLRLDYDTVQRIHEQTNSEWNTEQVKT